MLAYLLKRNAFLQYRWTAPEPLILPFFADQNQNPNTFQTKTNRDVTNETSTCALFGRMPRQSNICHFLCRIHINCKKSNWTPRKTKEHCMSGVSWTRIYLVFLQFSLHFCGNFGFWKVFLLTFWFIASFVIKDINRRPESTSSVCLARRKITHFFWCFFFLFVMSKFVSKTSMLDDDFVV